MNTFDKLYKYLLLELSDAAIRKIAAKFSNDASEEDVRRELADFEKYKAKIEKKDPFQYKTWIELTEVIHAAKAASEQKKDFKKADVEGAANADDIVADDENVTIYKGDSQDKCVLYGRGYSFCISRPVGGNMFKNYRLGKESTFYFIFFKKKSTEENDHIMVLDHTKNGYEWTFKDNNTQRVNGGWDEITQKYPELAKYKDLLQNKKLTNEEQVFTKRLQEFANRPSLQKFKEFPYKEQAQALKSIVNLPDEIWDVLDSTLRNEFISTGPNLTEHQADDLKPNELARYKKTRALSFPQLAQDNLLIINKYDDINQIASDVEEAYYYAKDVLKWQNVPDVIIKGFASDAEYALYYAEEVLKGQNVPDVIIKGFASDAARAYYYAKYILKGQNVPDEIIKSIVSDAEYAYYYAKDVLKWQNVPDEIIKGIASDVDCVKEVLKSQNVPDVFIKGIASDAAYASYYAKDVLKGQNVPDVIIKGIASDAEYAYFYAKYILKWQDVLKGQNVPDVIIKGIASDAEYAYYYAKEVLKWQNVPKEIIKAIQDFGEKEIPSETTIKENTNRIRASISNPQIMEQMSQRQLLENLRDWFAPHVDKKGKKFKGWINCKTGGHCGRKDTSKGSNPACRATKEDCKKIKGKMYKKKSSERVSWKNNKK
jgi:hypothetical protein